MINKTKFKMWLSTRNHGSIVGTMGYAETCPVTKYLTETLAQGFICVYEDKIISANPNFKTPLWVNAFLTKLRFNSNKHVTREQSLRVLKDC